MKPTITEIRYKTASGRKQQEVCYTCSECKKPRWITRPAYETKRSTICSECHRKHMADTAASIERHPLYSVWKGMHARCYRANNASFKHYGGRGVEVCERWRGGGGRGRQKGFLNFVYDMGDKPGSGYSLDRINPDGNYSPDNCRWATNAEQQKNKNCHPVILSSRPDPVFLTKLDAALKPTLPDEDLRWEVIECVAVNIWK